MDSHLYSGYTVPPNYDSLIAKLIAFGDTRESAIARMRTALDEIIVEGIRTNVPMHVDTLNDSGFIKGGVGISYLERKLGR